MNKAAFMNDDERRKNREKARPYYEAHPESVRAASRARYAKERVFFTDRAQQADMLEHPRKSPRQEDVVCLAHLRRPPGSAGVAVEV